MTTSSPTILDADPSTSTNTDTDVPTETTDCICGGATRVLRDQQGGRARDLPLLGGRDALEAATAAIPANTNINASTGAAAVATNGQHATAERPPRRQGAGLRPHHIPPTSS